MTTIDVSEVNEKSTTAIADAIDSRLWVFTGGINRVGNSYTKRHYLIVFKLIACAFGMSCGLVIATEPRIPDKFTPLFDGKSLTGWKGLVATPDERAAMSVEQHAAAQLEADERMRAHWKVIDGVLHFDGNGDSLCTERDYNDFELYVDWKIPRGGDSGIYLRGSPQVQIWDTEFEGHFPLGAQKGSGALWNNERGLHFPLVKADKAVGSWNRFYIRMLGEHVSVELNDKLVVNEIVMENYWDRKKPIFRSGSIELQNHDCPLQFKNIFLREIPADESNAIFASRDMDKFKPIFNGRDFSDWTGDLDSYEIKNGVIQSKPGKHGIIHTTRNFSNFVARVEFNLPPGGNSGVAIRYSGSGLPSANAMCELQVLDSTHPKYANFDPREHHGSAYGMVPAHRGYLRKPGQWNFQQITVIGSKIRVELNGTTILDTDLSRVNDFMGDFPHPEKDRSSGYFGFAGHGDPVQFRNISIQELD